MISDRPTPAKPPPDFLSRTYWNGTIKMSLSKFFILCVLHKRPMHGYDIAREVTRMTNGCCSPAEGTIYPVLRQYEEAGCVTAEEEVVGGRLRRVYAVTETGRAAFRTALAAWMEITQCLEGCRSLAEGGEAGSCGC